MKETVYELNILDVFPNPNQPRKRFDDQSIKELADSISAY
jgi:ParB-like chromosome segregation protein Spo0J